MKTKSKILFLSLSTFNETGGIQNICKTLCRVLTELFAERKNALHVISLNDNTSDADERYLSQSLFTGYRRRKWPFAIVSVFWGLKSSTVILGHIHLLPLAVFIKLLNPGCKIILLAHGVEAWNILSRWKALFLNRHTDIWAVSRYTRETMIQQQLSEKRIIVLNNCLDPFFKVPCSFKKPGYLLRRYQLQSDQPVLFSLNRLSAEERGKGYDQVLNVIPGLLKVFPNLCYLLGGPSTADERVRLQNQILNKRLTGHVKMIGYIHERELADHYLLADLFVLPSKKEGFGLVYMEAAACGCKIICGNRDGSTDAVLQGGLGELTDPSNKDQLHRLIVNSLKKEHTPYQQQQLCLEHFSYKTYKQKVKTLLDHES